MKLILRLLGVTDIDGNPFLGGIGAWFMGGVFIVGGIRTDEPLAVWCGGIFIAFYLAYSIGFFIKNGR